jgi:hypothetical protein
MTDPVALRGPLETREGDAYVYTWADLSYGMRLRNLLEERDGLDAEVETFAVRPTGATVKRTLIHEGRLRLLGTNSKRDLARVLQETTKGLGLNGVAVDWRLLIEVACRRTKEQYRQGEPVLELADVEPKPQTWLLEGLVPEGRSSLLIGDGMSTKSIQAVAMALAVVTGRAIGPYRPARTGPVLYADAETDEGEQAERAHRIALAFGLPGVPRGFFYQQQLRSLVSSRQGLHEAIARTGAVFVVLDSAGALANGSLNEDAVAIAMCNALRSLGDVTRLVISHVSKTTASQEKGRGRAIGSIFFENYARSILEARREGQSKTDFLVGLYHRKVNRGALRDAVAVRCRFEDPFGPIRLSEARISESQELAGYGQDTDAIIAALEGAGGAMDFPDLERETGLTGTTLRRRLSGTSMVVQLHAGGGRGIPARWGLVDRTHAERT